MDKVGRAFTNKFFNAVRTYSSFQFCVSSAASATVKKHTILTTSSSFSNSCRGANVPTSVSVITTGRMSSAAVKTLVNNEVSSTTLASAGPESPSKSTDTTPGGGETVDEVGSTTTTNPSLEASEKLTANGSQVDTVGSTECQVSQSTETSIPDARAVKSEPKILLRKRKSIIMLSYCGQEYLGMQRNPGMKTIEDDLLQSLLQAGYIDEEAYQKPQVMQFQRSSRTDKSVSAARQVVSLKLPDVVDLDKINTFLPPQIRVMDLKKVTKGFDCKSSCDARTYSYMLPTFSFVPVEGLVTEDYRITPEVVENLRETLKLYLGTKNFHNYTSRKKASDPSAHRYIMSFTASEPFEKDGLEYIILRVKGQSFMMHQIRKMIGLVVAYMRGFAGKDTFVKSWGRSRIDIPKVPGVGLVLDQVHYDRYNQRYGSDGMHAKLTWEDLDEKVEAFCQQYIYPVITQTENEEKSMFEWLSTLPYHTYDVREEKANSPLSGIGKAAMHVNKNLGAKGEDSSDDEEDSSDIPAKKARQE